jgi:hypothetical protein
MNIRLLAAFSYLSFAAMTATAGAAGEVTLTVVNHSVYGITIRTANGDDPTGGHCNNGDVEAGSTVSLSCPSIHQQDWAVLASSH